MSPRRRSTLPGPCWYTLLAIAMLMLGATGLHAEPVPLWLPASEGIDELPDAAELYYVGLEGRLVGLEAERLPILEKHGARVLEVDPDEVIYVALVESAERAEFEPPARVLLRSDHEVLVASRDGAPRLTESARLSLQGLRELVRIDRHPIPAPVGPVAPPAAREVDPLIAEIVGSLTEASYVATWQILDDFETRYTFTSENEQASQWMLEEFQSFGLDAEFHYYNQSGQRRNVIATLPGLVDPTKVVYITSHFDATSPTPEVCAPGADDNGSGTAAVIEAARVLSQYAFEYTIKFACFNGEEQGLVGSAAYVADIAAEGEDVIAAYNCDMIAYRGNDPDPPDLVIYTNSNSLPLATTLEGVINDYLPGLLEPLVTVEALNASDHASFWAYGYPAVVSIEDEAWGSDFCPWYHTCDDRIERYPHDYATACAKGNVAAVATVAMPIDPEGSFLAFGSAEIDDDQTGGSSGNGDGDLNPGERIELLVTVRNLGQQSATNVTGQLSIESEHVTILDGNASWDDIPSGGEGVNQTPFLFDVSSSAIDTEILSFVLTMTDDYRVRTLDMPLAVVAPDLSYRSHTLDDATHGNGNGIPEPGEVLVIAVTLANDGGQDAVSVEAVLSSTNPHVVTIDGIAGDPSIPSGLTAELSPPYRIAISADAVDGETLPLDLAITAGQGYAASTGFTLRIGSYFYDDVEADGAWSLSAAGDDATSGLWVRVDPNGTIYDGQPCQPEDDHTAAPGTDCFVTGQGSVGGSAGENDVDGGRTTLTSPTFDLTSITGPQLSYWRWYTNDLGNNPGEDTWVVEISSDGGASWVDLERTSASANSWQERSFLLADYITPTADVVVRFVASDEGSGSLVEAAVDDVMITGELETVGIEDATRQLALRLDPVRPNPTTAGATLSFAIPAAGRVVVRLYGIDGRLVRTLIDQILQPGSYRLDWDGRAARGAEAAPGVYFAKMRADGRELTRRLVLVR